MNPVLCAMNDGKQANLNIRFGNDEESHLYFCSEGCRQRFGLIGVSRIAMQEIEARQSESARRNTKKEE